MRSTILSPSKFIPRLTESINDAKQKVYIQTLYFEYGQKIKPLEKSLLLAADRDVQVKITVDWISNRYILGELNIFPQFNGAKKFKNNLVKRQTANMFDRLQKEGVEIKITNKPTILHHIIPIFGRNHTKIFIVDNTAWIGGMNIGESNLGCEDFMIEIHDPLVVGALEKQFFMINQQQTIKDYLLACGDSYQLLVDKGDRGKSIIYKKAIQMICSSQKKVVFISQSTPDGELLKEMIKAAHRGVDIFIITSTKQDLVYSSYPYKLKYLLFRKKIKKNARFHLYHCSRHVHSKLLLVDDKMVLFGSHNLVWLSVLLGTGEADLFSTENNLVLQLIQYVENLLHGCIKSIH